MTTSTSTFIICSAVLILPIIQSIVESWFKKNTTEPKVFKFPSPLEVLRTDLGRTYAKVVEQLNHQFKGSAFPLKVNVPTDNTYTHHEDIVPIISALLEREGWVISKHGCAPNQILVNLPKKVFT